jgi:hypothetical protein
MASVLTGSKLILKFTTLMQIITLKIYEFAEIQVGGSYRQ